MPKPRGIVLLAAGAAAALMLSACSTGGAAGNAGSPTTGISSKKVVTIGLNSVLSGPQAAYAAIGYGAEAYLKDINDSGGINGYTFDFQQKDNALSAGQAASAARALSTNSFLLVSGGTAPVKGMLTVTKALKIPSFGAANGLYYTPPGDSMAFGQNPDYSRLVASDTRFMVQKLKLKKLAYLYQNDDVGTPASKVIDAYAKSLGAEIVAQVPVPSTSTDFSSFAALLKQSGAEGVVFAGAPAELSGVQNAAAGLQYNPKWIGFWSLQDPSYTTTVPADVLANTYSDAWMVPIVGSDPEVQKYKTVITKYYPNIINSSLAEQGWNFGAIIAEAVKSATANGKALTRDTFVKALQTDFTGQSIGLMTVKYDSSSHAASSSAGVYALTSTGIGEQASPMTPLPTP